MTTNTLEAIARVDHDLEREVFEVFPLAIDVASPVR
jgi:hypothetical protein